MSIKNYLLRARSGRYRPNIIQALRRRHIKNKFN